MDKTNKICLIISIICITLVVLFCAFLIIRHQNKEDLTDALKFKKEYEQYNLAKTDEEKKLISIDIPENNPIVYKTAKEIEEILNTEDAIIYFGYSICPWSRNVIKPMLDASRDLSIANIYYLDIKDIRDEYEFVGTVTPKKVKEGTDAYYNIVNFFGEKLEKYYVKDSYGNLYGTGVRRINSPTVVTIKNKKITGMHEKTIEKQTDPYQELTSLEEKELYDIYYEMFQKFLETESN